MGQVYKINDILIPYVSITGLTYNNNTIFISDTNNVTYSTSINNMTGLTINGALNSTTISATTYVGLPTDVRVTGGTYNAGTATFTNNTGGTFSVSGFSNTFTGGTIAGGLVAPSVSATTISATTYYGNGTGLTNVLISSNNLSDITNASTALLNIGGQPYHGFVNQTDSTLPQTISSITGFTLTTAGSYVIYVNGSKYTINTTKSVSITNTVGSWFIYLQIDAGIPTLYSSQSAWNLLDLTVIPVATIYWTGSLGHVGEERHAYNRNLQFHNEAHSAWGAQYISGGVGATFGSAANNTFSIPACTIADEDIRNTTSSPQTTCRLAYRSSGGTSLIFDAISTTYAKISGGLPLYDNNTGTPIALSNSNYGISYIYMTNYKEIGAQIVIVLGQGDYSSLALAQAAPTPSLTGLLVAEWKLFYRVYYTRTGGALLFRQADPQYALSTGLIVNGGTTNTVSEANVTTGLRTILSGTTQFLNNDIIESNLSSLITGKAYLTGATFTGNIIAPSVSATTISGTTLYGNGANLTGIPQYWVSGSTGTGSIRSISGNTVSTATYSFAVGSGTTASGTYSHAEGFGTTASGYNGAHAEGYLTTASGWQSHAECNQTISSGDNSHAEGYGTLASGGYSHAEGISTIASNTAAHSEGGNTTASGNYSHAGGYNSSAKGDYSFIHSNSSIINTGTTNSAILGGTGNTVNANIVNSIILGGSGLTATENNTVYGINFNGSSVSTPIIIGGSGTTQTLIHKTTSGIGATGADHIFQVGSNGATEAMRILNSGYVGIGTSTPSGKTHIYDTNSANQAYALRTEGTNTGTNWSGRIVAGGPTCVFLMGQYNNQAWLGSHNAALTAWNDIWINPDGTSKLLVGSYNGALATFDNATFKVGIAGALTLSANVASTSNTTGTLIVSGGTGISGNAFANNFNNSYTTTVTTNTGTTILTSSSTKIQFFTGTQYQAVQLPVVTGLTLGFEFQIHNNSTASIAIYSSGGNYICNVAPLSYCSVTCVAITGTSQTSWSYKLTLIETLVESFPRSICNNVNIFAGAGGSDGNWTCYGTYFTPKQTMLFSSTSTMNAILASTTTGYYILAVYRYAATNMPLMFATTTTALGGAVANISATVSNISNGVLVPGVTYYFVLMTNANPGMAGVSLGGTLALKPYRNFSQMLGNLGTGAAGVAPATIAEPTTESNNGTIFTQAII